MPIKLGIPIGLVEVGSPKLPELVYTCDGCQKTYTREEFDVLINPRDYPQVSVTSQSKCDCGGVDFSVKGKEG